MPGSIQAKLPYPISGDDIKAITLDHIGRLRRPLPKHKVQSVADCVLMFRNPRLRMMGFYFMLRNYQTDPAFLDLCRNQLNDQNPGIQLQAAIYLGQSAISSDPREPMLFPILVAALDSKEGRKPSIELSSYYYQQQPPGSGALASAPFSPPYILDPDEALRNEIQRALDRLTRYLTLENSSANLSR
jgi:hypothetical protein